mgnify:CR=1 FL=1
MEKHREDAEEDAKTWLDAIAVSEARIKECRESIHQMKGVAICPSCGASVDADAAFCSACGQKMPEKPKPEPVKEEDVEVILRNSRLRNQLLRPCRKMLPKPRLKPLHQMLQPKLKNRHGKQKELSCHRYSLVR